MLKKIINHVETYGYLTFKSKTSKFPKYIYGPPGEILSENIKKEWLYNVSLHRECNVYPLRNADEDSLGFTKEFIDSFILAKDFNSSQLPFGVVEIKTKKSLNNDTPESMYPRRNTILRYFGFYSEEEAEQSYYRWLLQRKRWWRRFSNDPGKFSFTEPDKTNKTHILAKFPWGDHHVETVIYHGGNIFQGFPQTIQERLLIDDGKKKYLPHLVESWCSLDYAVWTYLCDAFNEGTKIEKPVIRLHKSLAPYKFTAAAPILPNDKLNELLDLSHLILLELRKEGLHCLLPLSSSFGKVTLEEQLERSNALAIPYTVVLDLDTLETGIFGLYSRETTLQEQVHITKMKEYGQLLIKA